MNEYSSVTGNEPTKNSISTTWYLLRFLWNVIFYWVAWVYQSWRVEKYRVQFCPRRTHRKSVCPSGVETFTGVTPLPCNGSWICKSLDTRERWAYLKCVKLKAWNYHIIFWWQVWWWPRALYHETLLVANGPREMNFLSKISINGTIIIC